MIFYCADNGASGEGSPNGSVNEDKFFNGLPDEIEDNLPLIDKLGSPDTYNHYPTGWAVAFSTPYRMFKRYCYQGGVCDPLVVHWPAGIRPAARSASSTTTAPTSSRRSSTCCGVEMPDGRQRRRADAAGRHLDALLVRRRRSADPKQTQYYEMLGHARHLAQRLEGRHRARPDERHRQLRRGHLAAVPHRRGPGRGARPRRAAPGQGRGARRAVARGGQARQRAAAQRHGARGQGASTFLALEFKVPVPPSGQYTYYPGTTEVPERNAANVHGVSYKVLAEVELTAESEGVIFAHGSRFGGHALFVKDGKLHVRVQLPRHPARAVRIAAPRPSRASTSSASSSRRSGWASTTSPSARSSSTSTKRSSPSRRSGR